MYRRIHAARRQLLPILAIGHCAYGLIVAYSMPAPPVWGFLNILHSNAAASAGLFAAVSVGLMGGAHRRWWCATGNALALTAIARLVKPAAGPMQWWMLALTVFSLCLTLRGLRDQTTETGPFSRLTCAVRLLAASCFGLMISALSPRPSALVGGIFFVLCVTFVVSEKLAIARYEHEWFANRFGNFENFRHAIDSEKLRAIQDKRGNAAVKNHLRLKYPDLPEDLIQQAITELAFGGPATVPIRTPGHGSTPNDGKLQ